MDRSYFLYIIAFAAVSLGLVQPVFNLNTAWALDIVGTQGNDVIPGTQKKDSIWGLGGDDRIWGKASGDHLYGNDDDDRIKGNSGNDDLRGGDGDDVLEGNDGSDSIDGGKGTDVIQGNSREDDISGGKGSDIIEGNRGSEVSSKSTSVCAALFTFSNLYASIIRFNTATRSLTTQALQIGTSCSTHMPSALTF